MNASRLGTWLLACALALGTALPAWAGKKDDTLRWASDKELESVDSYFNTAREGVILTRLIWDHLVYRDPHTGEYKPSLASSYKWVNATTLEFELRKGITFHNGEKFDADDVVYTVNFVANPDNKVKSQSNVNWMKNAEKLGEYKVRINLKAPFPAALEYLAGPVPIYPNEYYAKVGPKGMDAQPIGTGPYKVSQVEPGKSVTFVKNTSYFQESPQGQPSIGKLVFRTIPEMNTQVAELVTGGLDWIWQVPKDQAEQLANAPGITVLPGETMRVGYIAMATWDKAGNSPVRNLKVRQAIAHAIDRAAIVKNLVGGQSRVLNSPCFPTQFGCPQSGMPTYNFDPAKAKKLLAEAGFPNGFTIDFGAYRERQYAEAMVGYLRDVGITANLRWLQYAALRDGLRKGEQPFVFMTWGSYSVQDTSAYTGNFFKFTSDDMYLDQQVKDLLDVADTSIDPKVRKDNYQKALARVMSQLYMFPLFSYSINYAFTSDLSFTSDVDEIPRFTGAKWK
ncbi:MAG TPA: ABC transporter substrate-binding protein [bacterium]